MFAFYLFLVSLVSFMVLWGTSLGAVNDWLHIQQGTGFRAAEGFVSAVGWALAAGLVWVFHWRSLRRGLRTGSRSVRGAVLIYLVFVTFGLAMGLMTSGSSLFEEATALLTGVVQGSTLELGTQALKLAISGGLWAHHLVMFYQEAKYDMTVDKKETKRAKRS
ncbi:MAG: hypothetical protein KF698_03600 [Anaerolineales bacterium]|nr:hypothetical protein [Anaerolineales bacterium]